MQKKKSILLFLSLLFSFVMAHSQTLTDSILQKKQRRAVRNVLWFTPTKAHQINGIAIGTVPSSAAYNNDSLTINGIHIETNPIMLMLFPYVIGGIINSVFKSQKDSTSIHSVSPDSIQYSMPNKINGINISTLGSAEMYYYKGISISSIATFGQEMKGISITGFQNRFYSFKGIMIAGFMNDATKGKGLQIALFNRCMDCKGVQIGLWNKMGKRKLPFLNIKF